MQLAFFLIEILLPLSAIGFSIAVWPPPVARSAARFAGVAGAIVMIALIGAISLTGRWPGGAIVIRDPGLQRILAQPAGQVARIEISAGEKDLVFRHRVGGRMAG